MRRLAKRLAYILIIQLCIINAYADDLDSLCKGYCLMNYQDGYYAGDGFCACITFITVPNDRLKLPKLIKKSKTVLEESYYPQQ